MTPPSNLILAHLEPGLATRVTGVAPRVANGGNFDPPSNLILAHLGKAPRCLNHFERVGKQGWGIIRPPRGDKSEGIFGFFENLWIFVWIFVCPNFWKNRAPEALTRGKMIFDGF